MTQIVVTLEEGTNVSLIQNAIEMIKGVRKALVKRIEKNKYDSLVSKRLEAFDKLTGSVSMSNIDLSDERTQYLLNK